MLTDKNGTTANPHDLPQNADHTNADLACATCHKLHGEDPIEQTALKACIDCHHAEVFECGTCHD